MPDSLLDFIVDGIAGIEARLSVAERRRVAGVGIAAPFELWSWAEETGAPAEDMAAWRKADLHADVAARVPYRSFWKTMPRAPAPPNWSSALARNIRISSISSSAPSSVAASC